MLNEVSAIATPSLPALGSKLITFRRVTRAAELIDAAGSKSAFTNHILVCFLSREPLLRKAGSNH